MSSTFASTSTESDDVCAVCYDSLDSKRSVTLHPCNHRFHRTCISQWFESGKFSQPKDFTCCLCRSELDVTYDEKEEIVPIFFPFELTEFIPSFIEKLPNYEEDLAELGCEIFQTIDSLHEEKRLAIDNEKNEEFIQDLDEEVEKLEKRVEAVEEIFITLALEEHIEMEFLDSEKEQLEEELAKATSLKIAIRIEELEGITRRIDYLEDKASEKFKNLCEMAAAAKDAVTFDPTSSSDPTTSSKN